MRYQAKEEKVPSNKRKRNIINEHIKQMIKYYRVHIHAIAIYIHIYNGNNHMCKKCKKKKKKIR